MELSNQPEAPTAWAPGLVWTSHDLNPGLSSMYPIRYKECTMAAS